MSTSDQSSNHPPADASAPVPVVPVADVVVGGTSETGSTDETVTPKEDPPTEPIEYQHVPLPTAGTIRVRYSHVEPLKRRRFQLEDDLP